MTNIISFLEYDSVRVILSEREKLRYEAGCVTLLFPTTDSAGRQATSTLTTSQVPLEYSLNEMGEDHYFHHPSNMSIE